MQRIIKENKVYSESEEEDKNDEDMEDIEEDEEGEDEDEDEEDEDMNSGSSDDEEDKGEEEGGGFGGTAGGGDALLCDTAVPRARKMFERFRELELAWLFSLPRSVQKTLICRKLGDDEEFPAHHVNVSGEVGLLLAGVKPCVQASHGAWPAYGDELAKAIAPWATEFAPELAEAHIEVGRAAGAVKPAEIPAHPGLGGALFIVRHSHPGAAAARAVFLSGRDVVPNGEIGRAFGYPGADDPAAHAASIQYMNADDEPYRSPRTPGAKVCCVPVLEFMARPSDARAIGTHFRMASNAARRSLGIQLSLDIEALNRWHDADLARLLQAAFGSDAGTFAATREPPFPRNELRMWGWIAPRMFAILSLMD